MALFLFFIILAVYSFFNLAAIMGTADGGSVVKVTKNGSANFYNLSSRLEIDLGNDGEKCVLQIKDDFARITESDCPNKICVKTGPISEPGQTIICLPHKTLVEIVGKSELDANIR